MYYFENLNYKFFIGILWSINLIGLCNSRVLFQENLVILFLSASVLFLKNISYKNFFVSVTFLCLALMTKTYSAFFIGVIFFYMVIEFKAKLITFKEFFIYCIILISGLAVCCVYVYYAYSYYDNSILNYTLFNKQTNIFFNILTVFNTNFFARIPAISICAMLFIFFNFFSSLEADQKYRSVDRLMMLWFIFFIIQQAQFQYNPLRYYIYLLPPIVYLACRFIMNLNIYFPVMPLPAKKKFVLFIFLYFAGYNFIWIYFRSFLNKHIHLFNNMELALGAALIFFVSFYLISIFSGYARNFSIFFPAAIIIISSSIGIFQYYHYFLKNPSFDLRDISADIGKILKNDSTLAGWYAPQLCIQNKIRALPSYCDSKEYFEKNKVTHLILEENSVSEFHDKLRLKIIKSYYIKKIKINLNLYEISN